MHASRNLQNSSCMKSLISTLVSVLLSKNSSWSSKSTKEVCRLDNPSWLSGTQVHIVFVGEKNEIFEVFHILLACQISWAMKQECFACILRYLLTQATRAKLHVYSTELELWCSIPLPFTGPCDDWAPAPQSSRAGWDEVRRPGSACPVFLSHVGSKTCPKNQNLKFQNLKSKFQNPTSKIQKPHKKNCYITVQNPKPKIRPKSLDLGGWIGKFWVWDSGFWITPSKIKFPS